MKKHHKKRAITPQAQRL